MFGNRLKYNDGVKIGSAKVSYQQTSFYPDDIPPEISSSEYEVLQFLKKEKKSLQTLVRHFPSLNAKKIVQSLAQKGIVEFLDDHTVKLSITKRQFDIYRYRDANGFNNDTEPVHTETPPRSNPFDFFTPPKSNPFDFDTPKNSVVNNKKGAQCSERAESGISVEDSTSAYGWSSDDVWVSIEESEDDPLLTDLKKHLSEIDISDLLKEIAHITIIPDFLMGALRYFTLTETEQEGIQVVFPHNPDVIKFEIIEAFIKDNDFTTKDEWISNMQKEYDYLAKKHVFPESIMVSFTDALNEVKDDELTLSNIREIKKIISDNA